jgi:cytochrome c biogenesis protein CcmG/thiol:disulfide interchange protein DsbE
MSFKNQGRGEVKRFWSPLRIVSTVIVLGLFAAFGISSCTSKDQTTVGPAVANNSGSTAPPVRTNPTRPAALSSLPASLRDSELRAASGSPIKLSDYSGKVLLVNLWATWCGPCRMETPELVKLHREFHSRGVEMVGLSTENPDSSAESVRDFVRMFNIDYRVGWASRDLAVTFMTMSGRDAIPQSFIIGRDGRILKYFVGFSPVGTPPEIRQALEDALKG